MAKDVIITPASGKLDFYGTSGGSVLANINLTDNNDLSLSTTSGNLIIGDASRDVYIGDGTNEVDIVFEQNGEIRSVANKYITVSAGQVNATGISVNTSSPNAVVHVYGSTPSGTVLNVEGTNGSLFSVVDNLDGTLMSVNNNAGLPVLEVFSDDSVVAGRFGQNDFVVSSSGNIGMGLSNPSTKLEVSGIITATSFSGAGSGLTGTASSLTAGAATTATNANNINISSNNSTDTTTYLVVVGNNATGNQSPFIDTGLSYNANINELNTDRYVGKKIILGPTVIESSLTIGYNADTTFTVTSDGILLLGVHATTSSAPFRVNASGSVTNGTWDASTISVNKGGTGTTSFTSNQVLVGNGTSAVSTLSRSGIDSRSTFPPASHAITTHSATAWRMFYSNATTTAIQELSFGNVGTYLRSGGASANPTWATIAYSEISGTPTIPTVNDATLTMNVSGTGLSGSQTFTANQSSNVTFTVTSNATSANTGSTIVARDASGNFSAGTITATLSGNASTVTDGVYTTSNQSIGGVKTFTSQIINTTNHSTIGGGGQIYLNGNTGNRIDFNTNGLGAPSIFTRSLGTKINLYPSLQTSSATDFAIGLANDGGSGAPTRFWQSVNNSSSRFEWFAGGTTIGTLTGAGVLSVGGSTSQINVDNLRLDGNTLSVTNTNGSLTISGNGTGSVFVGSESISFQPTTYKFEIQDSSPGPILNFNANEIFFKTSGGATPDGEIYALYIDRSDTDSMIGIGHNTPSQRLHVAGGNILCDRLYMEKTSAPTISSGSLTLNLNNGSIFLVSLNAAITSITISNVPSTSNTSVAFSIIFTADGTARSVTWPASVKWAGGVAPTLTSTNAKKDILSFVSTDQGTTWFGFVGGQNY